MSIVGATSLLGSYLHWRQGNFHWRAALNFGGAGMVGSYAGSTLTHLVSSTQLTLLFAGVMFVVGTLLLAGRNNTPVVRQHCSLSRLLATGLAVGCLSGFLGVGGGFLIVPALVWFAGLDTKRAVGTSLAIIAANCASGLTGQLRYTRWDPGITAEFVVLSLAGMIAGVAIASRTPDRMLRKVFAVLVLGIATAMCIKIGEL